MFKIGDPHEFVHHCELKQTSDGRLPSVSPYASTFAKCLHAWREFTTISQKHNDCKLYFRSRASFVKEKSRHLTGDVFRFTIHPLSRFVMVRKAIMAFYWLFIFFFDPLAGSFVAEDLFDPVKDSPVHNGVLVITNVLLFVDVVVNFFSGYIVEQTREIVLWKRKIWRHYILTYFVFDIIPIVSVICLQVFRYMPMVIQIGIFQLHFLRVIRLKSMVNYFDVLFKIMGIKEAVRICLHLALLAIVAVHWWACVLGTIPLLQFHSGSSIDKSWVTQLNHNIKTKYNPELLYDHERFRIYIEFMTVSMCHFYGAGAGTYQTEDEFEMLAMAIMLMTGVVFYVYALAKILHLFGTVNVSDAKYEELLTQVREYMITKKFPHNLEKRIETYYSVKFNKKFFKENDILDTLSEHLRMEVRLYSCSNLIRRVQLFRGMSRAAIGCILGVLQQEYYLPGDVILSWKMNNTSTFFILNGTATVQLADNKEITHVDDGCHFGDINKILKDNAKEVFFKYTAIEVTQVYILKYEDLLFCCARFPEIWEKFEKMSLERMKFYLAYLKERILTEETDIATITLDLKRGFVLRDEWTRHQ